MNHDNTVQTVKKVLASTYVLAIKTQNFHWNYEGAHFPSYHSMFEEQYDALHEAVDELAERIRQLGHKSPGSMKEFSEQSMIAEASADANPGDMVKTLAADHTALADFLHNAIEAEDMDEASKDLCIERIQEHEKFAWMLRATSK